MTVKRWKVVAVVLAAAVLAAGSVVPAYGQERVRLVYLTAGDVNMLALGQNVFAAEFKKRFPNVDVATVHTGPGEAGSRLIFEKLMAEKAAGKREWDVDVAMVHQVFMSWAMKEDLLLRYAPETRTYSMVTSAAARNALGTDVTGYVIPLFHSQTVLAYNSEKVPSPPRSYGELVQWVKANPRKFGYNGIKGGMSGVAFTVGWIYWKTGKYDKYAVTGPFEQSEVASWEPAFKELADFNRYVTLTAGNVGTLDALNRGEIWMGPVWVDMFYTFMQEGKMDPKVRLVLPAPGMPGQPMYFVIPKGTRHPELAREFVAMATSPEVQGRIIVERFNWYPGIDPRYVEPYTSPEAYRRLFADVTPDDLSRYGLTFPLAPYFQAMMEAYERWVTGR